MARRRLKAKIIQKSVGLLETEWAIVEKKGERTGISNGMVMRAALMSSMFVEQLIFMDENIMRLWLKFVGEFEPKIRAYDQNIDNPYNVDLLELQAKAYPLIPGLLEKSEENNMIKDLNDIMDNIKKTVEMGEADGNP